MFFDFLSRFCAFGFKVWKKYKYDLKKIFFQSKQVSKNADFHADFESVENFVKKCIEKKLQAKQVWRTWVKVKRAFFRHVLANKFFLWIFFQNFFNGFEISVKFCVFDTCLIFSKKNFRSYIYFFQTLIANAQETAQKNGKSFLWMCLKI